MRKINYETRITDRNVINEILESPCVRSWVKEQYKVMSDRDCVDAYYDALTLVDMLRLRMENKV